MREVLEGLASVVVKTGGAALLEQLERPFTQGRVEGVPGDRLEGAEQAACVIGGVVLKRLFLSLMPRPSLVVCRDNLA